MTKADLVQQASEAIGPGITKKDCALVVDAFLNAVKEALAEHKNIEIRGFGTF
jgi:integration host factor subunit beta